MENKSKSNARTWTIVTIEVALLIILLFPPMVSAKVDVSVDQLDDRMKFEVKNVGEQPTFVLNALTVLDEKGNVVYTSQDLSSAELLKIEPGISYSFEWNMDNIPEGKYKNKIYQGDNKRNLRPISLDFLRGKRQGKPILFTGKQFYKIGEDVDMTLMNMGTRIIYVNINNWEVKNLDTGNVVYRLSQDCSFGYGGCADSFEPLRFLKAIEKTWNQKDNKGNQVVPGKYEVTAEYSKKDPSSGKIKIETISTKKFYIRPQGKEHRDEAKDTGEEDHN